MPNDSQLRTSAERVVLFMPDYRRTNPYQSLLAAALREEGVRTQYHSFKGLFPVLRGWFRGGNRFRVLHLHWIDAALDADSTWRSALKGLQALLEIITLKLSGVALIYTAHNIYSHRQRLSRDLEHVFLWLFLRLCSRILVHSPEARGLLQRIFGLSERFIAARIVVVPHGHFINSYPSTSPREESRRALGFTPSQRVFLVFGDLRHNKGLKEFCAAFAGWKAQHARLLIVGKPVSRELAADLMAIEAADQRCRLHLGFVDEEKVAGYFAAADIACFPYTAVLTSGAMILAMSMGRPLLLPRSTPMGSVVNEGVQFTYDPGEPLSALQAAHDCHPLKLRELGDENRERVERMTWEEHARICRKAYGF